MKSPFPGIRRHMVRFVEDTESRPKMAVFFRRDCLDSGKCDASDIEGLSLYSSDILVPDVRELLEIRDPLFHKKLFMDNDQRRNPKFGHYGYRTDGLPKSTWTFDATAPHFF